ncbi:LytR C-terminal domain-containing protein [uncultured Pseudokineococcus sp.]|uniref:LytR C-terminal domain-containing protein n=1 Tax=uncultured Pseudokineococcus sp. TaxID=1642928 RepID=UPI002604BD9A|nr:LytR C-terminal domain-containing protein [uncultured Pseudokineococcus sp.]
MADDRPQAPLGAPDPDEETEALQRAERRRRRTRARQSLVFVAIFLVVLGIGIGAAGVNRGWWAGPFGADAPGSAEPSASCPTATTVPVDAAGVEVSVLNATTRAGLAGGVAQELTARGVVVGAVANAPEGTQVPGAAQILHGPEGERAAQGLASVAPGAELVRDDQRAGPAVDLVLGEAWTQLEPADTPLTASVVPDPASVPAGCPAVTPAPTTPAP